MGGIAPEVFGTVGGVMQHVVPQSTGWVRMNSGRSIGTGPLQAVSVNGQRQVMVNVGGYLHQLAAGNGAWYLGNTGINLGGATTPITAVYLNGTFPQVFANISGVMHQIYAGNGAWHLASSGLQIGSSYLSAVNINGATVLAANPGGVHHLIYVSGGKWILQSSGVATTTGPIYAVNVNGSTQVMSLQ